MSEESGIVFGLAEYAGAVAGLHLTSFTYGESGSAAEAVDEDGNVEQVDVHSKKRTVNFEGNVVQGADRSALTVGATLTVNDIDYKIETISVKYANTAHATASGTASAPMPAAASASGSGS